MKTSCVLEIIVSGMRLYDSKDNGLTTKSCTQKQFDTHVKPPENHEQAT